MQQSIILIDIYELHLFRPLRRDASSVCVCVCARARSFHAVAAAAVNYVATLAQ
jgi:hypothetical protein